MSDHKDPAQPRERRPSNPATTAPGGEDAAPAAAPPRGAGGSRRQPMQVDVAVRERHTWWQGPAARRRRRDGGLRPAAAMGFGAALGIPSPPPRCAGYNADEVVRALDSMPDVKVVRGSALRHERALDHPRAHDIIVAVETVLAGAGGVPGNPWARATPDSSSSAMNGSQHLGTFRPQFVGLPGTAAQALMAAIAVAPSASSPPTGSPEGRRDVIVYGETGTEDHGRTDANGEVAVEVRGGFLNQTAGALREARGRLLEKFVERPALNETFGQRDHLQPLFGLRRGRVPRARRRCAATAPSRLWPADHGPARPRPLALTGAGTRVAIIDSGALRRRPSGV